MLSQDVLMFYPKKKIGEMIQLFEDYLSNELKPHLSNEEKPGYLG